MEYLSICDEEAYSGYGMVFKYNSYKAYFLAKEFSKPYVVNFNPHGVVINQQLIGNLVSLFEKKFIFYSV